MLSFDPRCHECHLGTPPTDPTLRGAWLAQLRIVAAYRERWNITGPTPVDTPDQIGTIEQLGQQKRAQAAAQRALAFTSEARQQPAEVPVGLPSVVIQPEGVER